MEYNTNMNFLGKTVKDSVTGMIGIATLYTRTSYGLEQYLVEPEWIEGYGSEGRLLESGRLELVGSVVGKERREPLEGNRGNIFRK